MFTRRTVLKSTALSILGSVLPAGVIAKQVLSAPVIVVFEDSIAESVAFRDALKRRASGFHILHQDPAETFRELSPILQTDTIVLGCSKGAAAFVLGELARGQGGKMKIFAEHRCPDYLVTWGILPFCRFNEASVVAACAPQRSLRGINIPSSPRQLSTTGASGKATDKPSEPGAPRML